MKAAAATTTIDVVVVVLYREIHPVSGGTE
jgi:hypothetical protein